MVFDYTDIQNTAQRIIADRGRDVTLVIRDTTPSDPTQPWRGPAEPGTDVTLVATGVFVDSVSDSFFGTEYVDEDGSLIRRTNKAIMFAENAVSGINMQLIDKVIDGSDTYKVDRVNSLEPGGVPILYEVDIKK